MRIYGINPVLEALRARRAILNTLSLYCDSSRKNFGPRLAGTVTEIRLALVTVDCAMGNQELTKERFVLS